MVGWHAVRVPRAWGAGALAATLALWGVAVAAIVALRGLTRWLARQAPEHARLAEPTLPKVCCWSGGRGREEGPSATLPTVTNPVVSRRPPVQGRPGR